MTMVEISRALDMADMLRSRQLDGLEWFFAQLDAPHFDAEAISDETFAAIIHSAIDEYGVDPDAMCARFGINRSTVSRWKNGKTAPQSFARPSIVDWMKSDLTIRIGELRTELAPVLKKAGIRG
jgi:hypothetical protein